MEQERAESMRIERWYAQQRLAALCSVRDNIHGRVREQTNALGSVASHRDRLLTNDGGDREMVKAIRAERQQEMENLSIKIEALQRVAMVVGEIIKQEQRDRDRLSTEIDRIQAEAGTVGWAGPPRSHWHGQGRDIRRFDLDAPAGSAWIETEDGIPPRLTLKLINLERPEKRKLMAQIVGGDAIHRDFQCTAVEKIRGEMQWWERRADTVAVLAEAITTHVKEIEAIGWPQ